MSDTALSLVGDDARPRCPRADDVHDQNGEWIDEGHVVQMSSELDLRRGRPVLVLSASCHCGWSAQTVLDGTGGVDL